MNPNMRTGVLLGTGAAINVALGFIPDYVKVMNMTDGDAYTEWFRDLALAFTSGGTTEIVVGDTITGATSGATARVKQVLLVSGTWAGGDAAGWFILDILDKTGTFEAENLDVGTTTNLAAIAAAPVAQSLAFANHDTAQLALDTSNRISAYVGSTSEAQGFTIGTDVSESGKLLRYIAQRIGAGG